MLCCACSRRPLHVCAGVPVASISLPLFPFNPAGVAVPGAAAAVAARVAQAMPAAAGEAAAIAAALPAATVLAPDNNVLPDSAQPEMLSALESPPAAAAVVVPEGPAEAAEVAAEGVPGS